MSRWSRPGYAGKTRDSNEPEIVAALETIGCTVEKIDVLADLLVGRGGKNILLEVKVPGREDRADQKEQRKKRENWKGQIAIASSPMEAIDWITRLTVKNAY